MKQRLTLLTAAIGFALVGVVGCQHATDTDTPGDDNTVTSEQASEATVLFSAPTKDGTSHLHFGFHPDMGWKFFKRQNPVETIDISRDLARSGATPDLKSKLRTATQAQGQGQPNGNNGGNGGSDGGVFTGLAGSSGGPTYSASATTGQRFSGQAPGGVGFTSRTPASTSPSGPVYSSSPGTSGRFSASASAGAGQVCSLRSLCDFSQAVCQVLPSAFEGTEDTDFSCGSISQCYSYVDQAAAQASADLTRRQVCQISELFSCAADTIRRVRPSVDSADEGAFAILGSIFVCFSRVGLDVDTSSSSSGGSNSTNGSNGF